MASTHRLGLVSRIAAEHRRSLIALALTAAAGILTYVFAVYPLAERVANVEQRERAAEQALASARAELERAAGTLTGKARASAELATFYKDVLPQDLAGARRLTSLRLAQLARENNLEFARATYTPIPEPDSTLTRLQIQMSLTGSYADVRAFIYELETAPEFVVIDNVRLGGSGRDAGTLAVTLSLSTYYRGISSP
jgi:Tfp pilus assembly protein PilO